MARHKVAPKRTLTWGAELMRNALKSIAIKKAGDGKMFDGEGLSLIKSGDTGKWIYRYSYLGKRREMGLGPYPTVSLADARITRDDWTTTLRSGVDPIDERNREMEAKRVARYDNDPLFSDMVTTVFESLKATLRGEGMRGRWRSPLDMHMIPKIGHLRMSEISARHLKDALAPIWHDKQPTAVKAVNRTKIVFRKAKLAGSNCDPFTIEIAVDQLGAVWHKPKHITATPWQEIPALWTKLDRPLVSHRCVQFIMLTLVARRRGAWPAHGRVEPRRKPMDRAGGPDQRY